MQFHLEVVEFKKIFLKNGYHSKFIDKCIKIFLDKIFVKKTIKATVPKKNYFLVLPYLGGLSNKIQKQLQNSFQKAIPWGKINVTFNL